MSGAGGTIGNIRRVSRLTDRRFSVPGQPLPASTARIRRVSAGPRQIVAQGSTVSKRNDRPRPEIMERADTTPHAAPSLTRRRRIRARPQTGWQSRQVAGAAHGPAAARVPPWAGGGGEGCAALRTRVQAAPPGAVARRSGGTPGRRIRTSAASGRPTDRHRGGTAHRGARPRRLRPSVQRARPQYHRLPSGRARPATPRAEPARRSRESS